MTSAAWAPRAAAVEPPLGDRIAFGLGVLLLLIYSQGWVGPLTGDKTDADASGLIRALYYPAYAAGLALVYGQLGRSLEATLKTPLLVILLGLAAASATWSVDSATTARRVVALAFTSFGGLLLAARFSWARLAEVFAVAFAILVAGSWIAGVAFPGIGRMHEIFPGAWRGLWFEKNALGGVMAIGFAVFGAAALLNPDRARRWWIFAALALGLVLLSTSKTSLLALLLGGAVLAFVWLARRGPAAGVLMVWLAVVAILGVVGVVMFASDKVFSALGKDATLTGRTEIWTAAIRQIRTRPWLGFGYGAIWDNESLWAPLAKITKDAGFRAHHAHSSWVEMALNLGLTGLIAWGLWFAETLIRGVVAVFTTRGAYLALPFVVVYGLTSLTESVTLIWNDLRWVMFVAVAVKLALGDAPQAAFAEGFAARRAALP